MSVKQLTEHHLEFLNFKRGCRGSSESTLVKVPHYGKSYALAHMEQFMFLNLLHMHYSLCLNSLLTYSERLEV